MLGSGFLEHQLRGILRPGLSRLFPFLVRLRALFHHNRGSVQAGSAAHHGDEHRVSDYWDKQFEAMRMDNSYWLNNKLVEESTYRLMTDTPRHWLDWLLKDYFAQRTFNRSLSVCCGDGAHEIQLYASGKVRCRQRGRYLGGGGQAGERTV